MGEENKQTTNGINQSFKTEGTGHRTGTGPSTGTTSGGTGTRPGTEGGSGQKVPAMVMVTDPNTGESPQPKKKKKKGQAAAAGDAKEAGQNISMLVMACFSLAASKNPVWTVTPEEVQSISEPAGRILARMEQAEGLNKNADYFMLAAGIAMVIIPRIIMMNQNKKSNTVEGLPNGRTQREAATTSGPTPGTHAAPGGGSVKGAMPALVS